MNVMRGLNELNDSLTFFTNFLVNGVVISKATATTGMPGK